jgi:hypothetical protein
MDGVLSRRQVTRGMAGIAAVCLTGGGPAIVSAAPRVPRPPASPYLEGHYVMDEIRALYRTARDERDAFHALATYGDRGMDWSRLYVAKLDAATALRDWLDRNAPWEHALKSWLDAIHQDGAEQEAPSHVTDSPEAYDAAWQILDTKPRTMADAALHRQAAGYIFGKRAGAVSGYRA